MFQQSETGRLELGGADGFLSRRFLNFHGKAIVAYDWLTDQFVLKMPLNVKLSRDCRGGPVRPPGEGALRRSAGLRPAWSLDIFAWRNAILQG